MLDSVMLKQRRAIEISYRKLEQKFEANIQVDGKRVHVGYFQSKQLALKHCRDIETRIEREKNVVHPWERTNIKVGRHGRVDVLALTQYPQNDLDSSLSTVSTSSSSQSNRTSSQVALRMSRLEASMANTQHILGRRKQFRH
mmetsp:Transcript_10452/g.12715  ORF Transcript_10452/g.12715 Transcript_10452/m.12715 type:complete len:142 (+) Transcript_10452:125-550(+)